ncbi:female-specific protein transformer [Drosophila biarmipes]|uniref:female-specific protein transformer n=1 Tax=Drosophila biarmipes TaxID=125945 RepID=UPI0007E711AC|nr:female-specific protein transformer [Drosophila biarmipes]
MKMDADSSGAVHRDSHGSRSQYRRERENHGRARDKERPREEHKVPYFADDVREQDRVRRLRQRSPRSTRRSSPRPRARSRSSSRCRSQSSDRESRHRRHRRRSRSRNRSRSRSSERRHRQRSPHRYNPPPKIINYYVQVPAQDFYGMYGTYAMGPLPRFGYQRPPSRPPPFPSASHRFRHRPPFLGAPRFGYRSAWQQPPH